MFKPSFSTAGLAAKILLFGPVRKRLLQHHFEKRGAELVDKIKAAAPVRTGALRGSVRLIKKRKAPGVIIAAGGTPATARGPNLDEALLTEYGTRREKAEPFFWPTINAETGSLRQAIAGDQRSSAGDTDG